MGSYSRPEWLAAALSHTPLLPFPQVLSKAVLTFDEQDKRPSRSSCFKSDEWADIPLFQLNRPFLIFIQDPENSAPLFLGRVANPRK